MSQLSTVYCRFRAFFGANHFDTFEYSQKRKYFLSTCVCLFEANEIVAHKVMYTMQYY